MGSLIGEFIVTRPARSVYEKGVELFGFAPVASIIDEPHKELPIEIGTAVEAFNRFIDKVKPSLRATWQPASARLDTSGIDGALKAVTAKLGSMFSPDSEADPEDVADPLMAALHELRGALLNTRVALNDGCQKYLEDAKTKPARYLQPAQDQVAAWQKELEVQLGRFDGAGRSISMAAAVALEHRAVYFKDPPQLTWSKFALADAAERLYQRGGDLPRDLQLRDSDDLSVYLKYAVTDVPDTGGNGNYLAEFESQLGRFTTAKVGDSQGTFEAEFAMADLLNRLGDTIDQMTAKNVQQDDLDDAVELSMVLTETVRGVLDTKRRGFDSSRADEEKKDPQKYKHRSEQAFEARGNLAHEHSHGKETRERDGRADRPS